MGMGMDMISSESGGDGHGHEYGHNAAELLRSTRSLRAPLFAPR